MRLLASIVLPVLSSRSALARQYSILDTYQGSNFFSMFQFFTAADPTHGRMYVLLSWLRPSSPHRDEMTLTAIMSRETSPWAQV